MSTSGHQGSAYSNKSSSKSKHYAVRICLLGESGSGKSSLFYRVKHKAFRDSPEEMEKSQTISSEATSRNRFYDSYSTVRRLNQRTKINLTLMDTGSRERYQSLTAQYYRRANVIILVCSLDSEHTLTRLSKWHAEAQYYIDNSDDIVYAVVGTKCDLPEVEKEVTTELLHNFARHLNIDLANVFEVSALSGEGVEEMMTALCGAVVEQFVRSKSDHGGVTEAAALLPERASDRDSSMENYYSSQSSSLSRGLSSTVHMKKKETCCHCVIL